DATLGEKLFEVPVGQPVPQVPPHRQQDHPRRETETDEPRQHRHRRPRTASALHRATITATVRSVNATEPLGGGCGPEGHGERDSGSSGVERRAVKNAASIGKSDPTPMLLDDSNPWA